LFCRPKNFGSKKLKYTLIHKITMANNKKSKDNKEEVTEQQVEDEKRELKKLMPPDKRIEEHKALQVAGELEKRKIPSKKEETEEVEGFMEESVHARKLLKPLKSLRKNKRKK
jgi:hypothetical protein